MQQLGWQRHLSECGAFFWGKELARQVIGLRGGMYRARQRFLRFNWRRILA
jgi:hypothetical protein